MAEARRREHVVPEVVIPKGVARVPPHALTEHAAMDLLEGWGVPCARRRLARSEDEAARAAREVGGAVALKIVSADILHKTDVGGVLLDVDGEEAARAGFRTLMERVATRRPDAEVEGVLVAAMVEDGADAVVGVTKDATFGPAVMVGLGGVLVEVLDDVAFRLAPFGADEARRMIAELKGAKLFQPFRGRPELDVDALAELLSRMSVFAVAEQDAFASVDLNPVRVLPEGRGVAVLDALIVPESGGG